MSPRTYQTLARIGITIGAVFLLLLLRIDIASAAKDYLTAEVREHVESPRIIADYTPQQRHPGKLQIGAGHSHKPGWLNTDIEPESGSSRSWTLLKTFPLPDRSFKYIYSEAVFEHITYEQGLVDLKESYRVLGTGRHSPDRDAEPSQVHRSVPGAQNEGGRELYPNEDGLAHVAAHPGSGVLHPESSIARMGGTSSCIRQSCCAPTSRGGGFPKY